MIAGYSRCYPLPHLPIIQQLHINQLGIGSVKTVTLLSQANSLHSTGCEAHIED